MFIVDSLNIWRPDILLRDGSSYLEPKQILHDSEQAIAAGGASLKASGPVTFSGVLTNRRVYPGKKVKAATKTWTTPFPKPILRHHRSGKNGAPSEDPIGRATDAKYVSTTLGKHWEDDYLHPTPEGSGYIDLTHTITDPDAIQKVMDKRYLTMSIGFDTDSLCCNICGTDWMKSERGCEHTPGEMAVVDSGKKGGKKSQPAWLITGSLTYEEASFVNRPASPYAAVSSFEKLQDALQDTNYSSRPDVLYKWDELLIDGKSYEITTPDNKEIIELMDRVEKLEEVLVDSVEDEGGIDADLFAEANIMKSLKDGDIIDLDACTKEGIDISAIDQKIALLTEDAKLSSAQRKKLKGSSFCGPGKSFPVPDCAHVTAARRLIGRAKLSSDQKSKVLACVSRKAKSLGCGGKDMTEDAANKLCSGVADDCHCGCDESTKSSTKVVSEPLVNLSKDNKSISSSDAKDKETTKMSIPEIKEVEKTIAPVKVEDNTKTLTDALTVANKSLGDMKTENEALRSENTRLLGEVVEGMARRLVDLRIQLGDPTIDSTKYEDTIKDLSKRSRVSLEDAIQDETKRLVVKKNTPAAKIVRGSVTAEDAGVQVDVSKDEPKVDSKAASTSPSAYKSGIANRFKNS